MTIREHILGVFLISNLLISSIANAQLNTDLICKTKIKEILLDGTSVKIKKVKVLLTAGLDPEYSQIKYSIGTGKIESTAFSFGADYIRISDLINNKKKYAFGVAANYSISENKGTLSFALLKIENDGTSSLVQGSAKNIEYGNCEYTHESRE